MNKCRARRQADQALAVPAEPVARLGPLGFDPSRGFWTENYIDDAASARTIIRRSNGTIAERGASNYDPPTNGIHLCGVTDDEEQPTTVALYEMHPSDAERYFEIAKGVAVCAEDEADFVVDLCIGDSIEDDFWSNRQLWSLAIRAWNAAIAMEARQGGDVQQAPSRSDDSAGRQASPGKDRGDHD